MAFESNIGTVIGNLTDDPDLRYTSSGVPVVSLRLASNRTYTKSDGEKVEEVFYISVNAWRSLAENAGESFSKGDRVVAIGRLNTRSYENREGQTVWVTELEADELAGSTRWAKLNITRQKGNGRPPSAAEAAEAAAAAANTEPASGNDELADIPF